MSRIKMTFLSTYCMILVSKKNIPRFLFLGYCSTMCAAAITKGGGQAVHSTKGIYFGQEVGDKPITNLYANL